MVVAFDVMAAAPSLSLLHRYETPQSDVSAHPPDLDNAPIMLRTVKLPNKPSPISEQPPPSKPLIPNHLVTHALTLPAPRSRLASTTGLQACRLSPATDPPLRRPPLRPRPR